MLYVNTPVRMLFAVLWLCLATGLASAQETNEPPLEYFAVRDALSEVSVSPNGEYLLALKVESRDGVSVVEIRRTDDLGGEPVWRFNAAPAEILSISWVSDRHLIFNARRQIGDRIEDVNQGTFAFAQGIADLERKELKDVPDFTTVLGNYVADDDYVLARGFPGLRRRSDGSFNRAIGSPDLFKYNLNNGRTEIVLSGVSYGNIRFDSNDRVRGGERYDPATREIAYFTRDPETREWDEFYRFSADTLQSFSIAGFDPEDDNKAFVVASNGQNFTGLYEFDLRSGSFGEELFRVANADVVGVVRSTRRDSNRVITGVGYYDSEGRYQRAFLTTPEAQDEQSWYATINAAFPSTSNSIVSRSLDDRFFVIYSEGPRDPGSYRLLINDGEQASVLFIGSRSPLRPEMLSDVQFIEYQARDGRTIPAYVTIPEGEGPFPLVVLPHGGPWVPERITYDEWGQLLASRGYMVLQPGFRGTLGYGLDHWESSFGEWGLSMSDDMDDGALFLVEQGVADPDRLAMFGWSFGGYSALAASVRSPQIYQCAISGAPVSDPIRFRANFEGGGLARVQFAQLERGYDGLIVEDMTADVNIPLLIVHGDLDQRVLIRHSEAFIRGLERNGKPYRFVVLEGADHFSNTLTFDHQMTLYTELTNYLANECGPGGL